MATTLLVANVHHLSRRFRQLLGTVPAEDPFAAPPGVTNWPPFIFEVSALLRLLAALRVRGYTATVVRRGNRVKLARAPSLKSTTSFFRLRGPNVSLQLTQGTEVEDRFGQSRAPDLCLQLQDSPDAPTFQHVLAIWDMKLRGDDGMPTSDAVTKPELAYFLLMADVLEIPPPTATLAAMLAEFPPAFEVSGVITNGRRPTEPDALLLDRGVSVVEFFIDEDTPMRPSRKVHVGTP